MPTTPQQLYQAVIAWLHDGTRLSAGIGQTIYIWNTAPFQLIRTLAGGSGNSLFYREAGYNIAEGFQSLVWNQSDTQLRLLVI
jgi:hypothetical protein